MENKINKELLNKIIIGIKTNGFNNAIKYYGKDLRDRDLNIAMMHYKTASLEMTIAFQKILLSAVDEGIISENDLYENDFFWSLDMDK